MPIAVYKDSSVISQPRLARTQWEKARGLMFSAFHDVLFHFPEEQRLKFHMVFVFYPIDIIFMDKEMRVVDLKERFKPFTFYYSKACSSTVLETYDGFIKEHEIAVGDQLAITHNGEMTMTGMRHEPESRMLHTTSLGTPRPAVTRPVATNEQEAALKPKRTTKRAAKPTKTPRNTTPAKKRTTKKTTKPTKKATTRTGAQKAPAAKKSPKKRATSSPKRSTTKKAPNKRTSRKAPPPKKRTTATSTPKSTKTPRKTTPAKKRTTKR